MKNKLIQGYFLLDRVEVTEEVQEQLNQLKRQYLVEWDLICEKNNRELYLGVLRDKNKIVDSVSMDDNGDEQVSYGLLTVMSSRNPEVIGVWNEDGTELGTTLNITPATYDEEGIELSPKIENVTGTPLHPFNKTSYQSIIPPRIQTDEEGNEISRTEFYDINSFGGFKPKRGF